MARPRKKIDPKQVESLAAINCTVEEIASVLECSKDTLERRFAANIKRGRDQGKSSLRRMMYERAKAGNVTMMIWLSKQMLGYADKIEQNTLINQQAHIVWDFRYGDDTSAAIDVTAETNASTATDLTVPKKI